jgi:hypothetical protein
MTRKQSAVAIIAVSIFFAIAILISSYLLAETDHGDTAMFILIALWFIPFTYLSAKASKEQSSE